MAERYRIASVFERKPTYVMDPNYLVDVHVNEKRAKDDLIQRVDDIRKQLQDDGMEDEDLYFGKTFVRQKGTLDFKDDDPKTWDTCGISRRYSDHKCPKEEETQGERYMIIISKAIMKDSVPDSIKQKFKSLTKTPRKGQAIPPTHSSSPRNMEATQQKNSTRQEDVTVTPQNDSTQDSASTTATNAAEYYALELEKHLIDYYQEKAATDKSLKLAKQGKGKGGTGENFAYVVYMRFTNPTTEKEDDQVERTAEKLDKLRIHVNSGKESGTQGERPKEGTPKNPMGPCKPRKRLSYGTAPAADQKNETKLLEDVKVTAKMLSDQMDQIKTLDEECKLQLTELQSKIEQRLLQDK